MGDDDDIIQVLELFSGIGGMHYALRRAGISAQVASAVDISDVANRGINRSSSLVLLFVVKWGSSHFLLFFLFQCIATTSLLSDIPSPTFAD